MAVVYRNIIDNGGGVDSEGIRTYSVKWHVHTDDPLDGGLIVTDTGWFTEAILYISTYVCGNESDSQAVCVGVKPERMSGSLVDWEVTVDYSTKPIGTGQTDLTSGGGTPGLPSSPADGNNQVAPTSRPWKISFDSVRTTKFLTKDKTAPTPKDVVASNGQPFDPPLEVPCSHPTFTITAYKAAGFNPFPRIEAYTDAVNNDVFLGFAARSLRCEKYTASSQFDNGVYYWELNVTIEVNRELWNPVKKLDAGTFEKDSFGELVQILDRHGNAVTSPVPLNNAGRRLTAGANLEYREFKVYDELAYATII